MSGGAAYIPEPQHLPASRAEREALRQKGQFWTPQWVAVPMARYALGGGANVLFDPAVGAGAFFHAAKRVAQEEGRAVRLCGRELDAGALSEAECSGLSAGDLSGVELADFVLSPPGQAFPAITANPPYKRHHRLPPEVKEGLRRVAAEAIGQPLDGRAGLHAYFLIRALQHLQEGGRLAFLLPADVCEGKYAPTLWQWVTRRFRLEAVISFASQAAPFPRVDTNALVFLVRNAPPLPQFWWARVGAVCPDQLDAWVASDFAEAGSALTATRREVAEALQTGLSRPPRQADADGPTLGDFASVVRGIATGANAFFFLTEAHITARGLPPDYFVPALGRTRDVEGDRVSGETLRRLEAAGRPTRLLYIQEASTASLPDALQRYLAEGEAQGLPARPLIRQRRAWYKMETRRVPPFLFAYLGRRNARFVRNEAGVLPLTGFLCVYPHADDATSVQKLRQVLSHPQTVENLALVGKSYGSGAIKVEPRALERLPLPSCALEEANLTSLCLF